MYLFLSGFFIFFIKNLFFCFFIKKISVGGDPQSSILSLIGPSQEIGGKTSLVLCNPQMGTWISKSQSTICILMSLFLHMNYWQIERIQE
jgi:hypothetical protein